MSFGSFDAHSGSNQSASAEINMVPLIDVMLVLLVIFLIAAPLITHSINVQLPQVNAQAIDTQQESLDVTITAEGEVFFADTLVEMSALSEFLERYQSQAQIKLTFQPTDRKSTRLNSSHVAISYAVL